MFLEVLNISVGAETSADHRSHDLKITYGEKMASFLSFRYKKTNFLKNLVHFSPGIFILSCTPIFSIGHQFFLLAAGRPYIYQDSADNFAGRSHFLGGQASKFQVF